MMRHITASASSTKIEGFLRYDNNPARISEDHL